MQLHASWFNDNFQIGPWFWRVNATVTSPRPLRYHAGSLPGLEVGILAEATEYLHGSKQDLQRMRSVYNTIRADIPKASQLFKLATTAAMEANVGPLGRRLCSTYSFGLAVLLGMASCLNYLLRDWDSKPIVQADARVFVDEIILLADRCASYQPYGVTFLPDYLKMVLASTPDSYRASEIESILVDYEKNFEGAVFVEEAFQIRRWLQRQAGARTGQGSISDVMEKHSVFSECASIEEEE